MVYTLLLLLPLLVVIGGIVGLFISSQITIAAIVVIALQALITTVVGYAAKAIHVKSLLDSRYAWTRARVSLTDDGPRVDKDTLRDEIPKAPIVLPAYIAGFIPAIFVLLFWVFPLDQAPGLSVFWFAVSLITGGVVSLSIATGGASEATRLMLEDLPLHRELCTHWESAEKAAFAARQQGPHGWGDAYGHLKEIEQLFEDKPTVASTHLREKLSAIERAAIEVRPYIAHAGAKYREARALLDRVSPAAARHSPQLIVETERIREHLESPKLRDLFANRQWRQLGQEFDRIIHNLESILHQAQRSRY